MKNLKLLVGSVILPFAIILMSPCLAQSSWVTLFNGYDLTGWMELNGKHKWEVIDGMIVGTTVNGEPNGFLCTERDFGDFVLELEVSIDTLMNNSGIQFRSLSYPDYNNSRVHGYQMEVDPKAQKWSGAIYEEGGNRGWIFTGDQLSNAAKESFKRDQRNGFQWNKYRIECIGTSIRTWINGIPATNLVDDKFLRGFIGLQLHANNATDPPGNFSVRFRNIRIQTGDLDLSPIDESFVVNFLPNNLSSQEEKNGYSLLWDGKSALGWLGPNKSSFPENIWSIKDGELNVKSNNNNNTSENPYIITEKLYGQFELKFDFKYSEGANSGVKYLVNESENNHKGALLALEFHIVDDNASGVTGNSSLGSLTGIMESNKSRFTIKKPGIWNQGLIKVLPDNKVEYWLNGYKILDFQRGSKDFIDKVSNSKYKNIPNFGLLDEGHILLENYGSSVSFRSIKIK